MKRILVFTLSSTLIFGSCNIIDSQGIKGNGHIISKNYDLKNFTSIDVGNASTIYLKQDSVFSVKIEADENLLSYINAVIEDGELDIDPKDGYNLNPSKNINVYISMPSAKKVSISGASTLKGENKFVQNSEFALDLSGASDGNLDLRAPSIVLDVSGASTMNLSGETRDVRGEISGASTLRAFDLKTENSNIEASGASTANVFASVSLTAGASGASSVRYKGNPKTSISANGAGSVKQAD